MGTNDDPSDALDEAWAQSLVGRDWEIYWEEETETSNDEPNSKAFEAATPALSGIESAPLAPPVQSQQTTAMTATTTTTTTTMTPLQQPTLSKQPSSGSNASSENQEQDNPTSEEEYATDWYDAHIISFDSNTRQFRIVYVGDEDVHEMTLHKSIVRPSARAWIARTKAMLKDTPKGEHETMQEWGEKRLPADTSMHGDEEEMEEMEGIRRYTLSTSGRSLPTSSDDDDDLPLEILRVQKENAQVLYLLYLIRRQTLLRSSLAPIVDNTDPGDTASEAYLNYLVQCLGKMERLCVWYIHCFELYEKLVIGKGNSMRRTEVEYVRGNCLECGRELIVGMISLDTSASGAKKRPLPSPSSSVRRKKRRKGYKSSGFLTSRDEQDDEKNREMNDLLYDLESHNFMPMSAVRRFVGKLAERNEPWYVRLFADMLMRICVQIQEPIVTWKREADSILATEWDESDESDDDETSKSEAEDISTAIEMSGPDEARQNNDWESDSEDEAMRYTYDEVKSFIATATSTRLLSRMNLSLWLEKLKDKLEAIKKFEDEAWHAVSHLVDEVGDHTQETDEILSTLCRLKEESESSKKLANIHPLGRASSRMTREVIDDSCTVRRWLLDLKHAERGRERAYFVQDVVSRGTNLPYVPAPPAESHAHEARADLRTNLNEALSNVQRLSSRLYSNVHVTARYERLVGDTQSGSTTDDGLLALPGVSEALDVLTKTPVISVGEEKLRVRHSILTWVSAVRDLMQKEERYSFDTIKRLKEQLEDIRLGKPAYRMELIRDLERNDLVDVEIRRFAGSDIALLSHREASWLDDVYQRAVAWKEKADSIVQTLRAFENRAAGLPLQLSKHPTMVDLKRVDDLRDEYTTLGVDFHGEASILQLVSDQCIEWTTDVERAVGVETPDPLPHLAACRQNRPKGVIMDPARHMVDLWIDLLDWHRRVRAGLNTVVSKARTAQHCLTQLIVEVVHPLLAEGAEIIEAASEKRTFEGGFAVKSEESLQVLSRLSANHGAIRRISRNKLESTSLGRALLARMISPAFDTVTGDSLLTLLFLQWHAFVVELVSNLVGPNRPSLESAVALSSSRPVVPDSSAGDFAFRIASAKSPEELSLEVSIQDGGQTEALARDLIASTKEVARGSFARANTVQEHLTMLKNVQAKFKSLSQGCPGLLLNSFLERSLDETVKDVAWLVRTLPYASLHFDDADEAQSVIVAQGQERTHRVMAAIPWDALVSLYERDPSARSERLGGDVARVSLRVNELYDAANAWQEEVSSQMSLSFRGGAKRRPHGGAIAVEEDSSTKLDLVRLSQLASHPILARVSMPREEAVKQVLSHAHDFERRFRDILDKDFEGESPDKASLPGSFSLVGRNGQFVLYRLTGGPLFAALKDSMAQLDRVANNIFADTPGKSAFEWIATAVKWIEELCDAVVSSSPLDGGDSERLSLPSAEAKRLLSDGQGLFFDTVTEDLRKTLSDHRIYLSTNKQTEKLTVVIGKGGAHHSLGGTIIRWCPLLLDCLKSDVARFSQWEEQLTYTIEVFRRDAAPMMSSDVREMEDVFQVYRFHERIASLLEEDCERLVIIPRSETITQLRQMQRSLESWATGKLSIIPRAPSLNALRKRFFEDAATVVDNRFSLLDSILNRRRLDTSPSNTRRTISHVPVGNNYRDKARAFLGKAFQKGMRIMGLEETNADASKMSHYCAMKAWVVEQAVFAAYQLDIADGTVSDKYRDKVRSLRHNLEDLRNPTLCPRVLLGEIEAERLIRMSPEELASKEGRQTRAKAEQEGRKNATLHPGTSKKIRKTGSVKSILGVKQKAPSCVFDDSPMPQKPIMATLPKATTMARSSPEALSSPAVSVKSPATMAIPSAAELQLALAAAKRPLPPAPPPVMATAAAPPFPPSFRSSPTTDDSYITSVSGETVFAITVSKFKFKAAFQREETDASSSLDGFLPSTLKEKGRLKIDEFVTFVSEKLRSGRWSAISIRLCPASDVATLEYKRYYKEYETGKQRISMIEVGKESKLYLVTPKFQKACPELRNSFRHSNSTYGVILKRKRQFS